MPNVRELLEQESTTVDLERGHFERMLRRRERRQRNRRLAAGVVALVVTLLTAAILLRSVALGPVPADPPKPPPQAALGALAYSLDGDFYVADWNGANPVRIDNGRGRLGTEGCTGVYWAEGTIWSPDGRYLAARHERCQDGRALWQDVVISDPEGHVVASFPSQGWLISWSADSTRVAVWVTYRRTIGIYGVDGERQELIRLPRGLMAPCDCDPVWSQDGASLLIPYAKIPLDGTPPISLSPDDPLWNTTYSPDGSRIAYRGRTGSLVVAAADGSVPREVSKGWSGDIAWSPTANRIAFSYSERSNRPSTEIRVFDLATGNVTSLIGKGGSDYLRVIEFSPEGDRVLFQRTADMGRGASSLWSVDADGSDALRLVTGTDTGDWQSLNGTR